VIEYVGLEIPWELCRSYSELAVEPGYSLFSSTRSSYCLYYIQGNNVWCQNSVSYYIIAVCTRPPLALRYLGSQLHILLPDGLCYVLGEEVHSDGESFDLVVKGSGFHNLHDFYD